MTFHELLIDLSERPLYVLDQIANKHLSVERANAHLGGHPNSIVWLLWHTGRELDMQLIELSGGQQVWTRGEFAQRTGLGSTGDPMGYGHSEAEARAMRVETQDQLEALLDYVRQSLTATRAYTAQLSAVEAKKLIDANVTFGVRLISIIDDAIQHLAQIQYVLGAPELR
ncbi:DinB family protein [Corynebacterium gerontici]|uniref:Uncharacterized protein n=1 Tax=Corynebacterium gerontici TaxID=2079234 RepID=A0A3G6IXU5_9CORY|nr:DinB family protein [Corynebacterium gerontici]AZA10383.1 hypothetical protein CGERO_00225 [Corynebacterium gerontici]